MHFLGYKINTIFLFCNAEMAKLGLITFKWLINCICRFFSGIKIPKKLKILQQEKF